MDDLRFRQIHYFIEIVKSGALLKAAERLHVTQPALTTSVRKLEETIGSKLLVRARNGIRLTESGKIFFTSAQAILNEYNNSKAKLTAIHRLEGGQVNLGALPIASNAFLPAALARFKKAHPNVGVTLSPSYNEMLLPSLKLGELDFVIGLEGEVDKMAGLTFTRILRDPICLIVRPDHPLASTTVRSAERLHKFPVFIPHPYREMHLFAHQIFATEKNEFPPNYIEANYYMAPDFVRITDAIAMLPLSSVIEEVSARTLAVLKVSFGLPSCRVGIVKRDANDLQEPARQAIVEILRAGERLKTRLAGFNLDA